MCRASMALPVSWKRKYTRTVPPSKMLQSRFFYPCDICALSREGTVRKYPAALPRLSHA